MIRQKKKYSRPQRPFDKARIEEENVLREKYGLKNKKEIWKADAAIGRIRNLAKELITKSEEEKEAFISRLQARGFEVQSIADALALNKEDWLKRRLQTVLHTRGLTTTPRQARQLIAHKHVLIGEQIVNVPSYMVTLEEEPAVKLNIVLKTSTPKPKKEEKVEEETEAEDSEIMEAEESPVEAASEAGAEESGEIEETAKEEEAKEEVQEESKEEKTE